MSSEDTLKDRLYSLSTSNLDNLPLFNLIGKASHRHIQRKRAFLPILCIIQHTRLQINQRQDSNLYDLKFRQYQPLVAFIRGANRCFGTYFSRFTKCHNTQWRPNPTRGLGI